MLQADTLYAVRVKHFLDADMHSVVSAEVYSQVGYNEAGVLLGTSRFVDASGLSFSAERLYMA